MRRSRAKGQEGRRWGGSPRIFSKRRGGAAASGCVLARAPRTEVVVDGDAAEPHHGR